ncbi:hypothetical protein L2E82_14326 [Cichorium intybus]|uniref:Uncharacterized protein n=1 Tax=Cichorium intybus TaxID=13427 RepID=A0ACB9EZ49_CICIN|nr:hypothetical protein L2E82_14326 [Cichorium intybus]
MGKWLTGGRRFEGKNKPMTHLLLFKLAILVGKKDGEKRWGGERRRRCGQEPKIEGGGKPRIYGGRKGKEKKGMILIPAVPSHQLYCSQLSLAWRKAIGCLWIAVPPFFDTCSLLS